MRSTLSAFFVLLLHMAALAQGARPAVDVQVDPRVELLTAVARLAGFAEFDMPNSRSPYAERVARRFEGHREHPAFATLRKLRAEHGVSYDAIPSLAVHLDGVERLALRAPLAPRPERLDGRWQPELTQQFLAELRDLSRRVEAVEFFAGEREFFERAELRLAEPVSRSRALDWFDSFFGAKPGARYVAIVGLLCGGGNYGVGVRLPDGAPEELTPVFGCWSFDESGVPLFDERFEPLFVHELCHSYTNPYVDRHSERLRAAGERIWASCGEKMRRQGYGNWRTVLYESLVRASVVRCRAVLEGDEAGAAQAREELQRHFTWVPELAKRFAEYEARREEFPSFESFMPLVASCLDDYAATLRDPSALASKLVRCTPENGASEVALDVAAMVFEFDRPMRDQSWSIVGPQVDQTKIAGKLAYDASRRRLTVPVRLEPGRRYRFWLNDERFQGFVSDEGVPLASTEISFSTASR